MTKATPRLKTATLSAHQKKKLPSARFEEGLAEWEAPRAHELETLAACDYAYYMEAFDLQTAIPQELRSARDEARSLCYMAHHLGWRVAPYTRMAAKAAKRPAIARDADAALRGWLSAADSACTAFALAPKGESKSKSHAPGLRALHDRGRALAAQIQRLARMFVEGM